MLACRYGFTKIMKFLIKYNVNINTKSQTGINAFMLACTYGSK